MNKIQHAKNILGYSITGAALGGLVYLSGPPIFIWPLTLVLIILIFLFNYLILNKKIANAILMLFFYAFVSRFLSVLDFRFVLINKTIYTGFLESHFFLALCVLEELFTTFILILALTWGLSYKKIRIAPYFVAILCLLLIDLIPLQNTPLWWSLWFYNQTTTSFIWEHFSPLGVALFPYLSFLLIFSEAKYLKIAGILILLSPFMTINKSSDLKSTSRLISVSVIAQAAPYQDPNKRPIISSQLISRIKNSKIKVYLWNEAFFIENNNNYLKDLAEELIQLPGDHYLGVYNIANPRMQGFKSNDFYHLNTSAGIMGSYQKVILNPIDEDHDFYQAISKKSYNDQKDVKAGPGFTSFKLGSNNIGIFLCNEIVHLEKILKFSKDSNLDLMLNPSNVPLFYKNSFEETLGFYSKWASALGGVPVLRYSSTNNVQLYVGGHLKQYPKNINGVYQIALPVQQP